MEINITNILIIGTAVWRLSSLIANEAGPFAVFEKLREIADKLTETSSFWRAFKLSEGIRCEWCNSIWISVPSVTLWLIFGKSFVLFALVLTLSAVAIATKYLIQALATIERKNLRIKKRKEVSE